VEKADPSWEYIIRSQTYECGNWDRDPDISLWEYLFQIFGILSLQCRDKGIVKGLGGIGFPKKASRSRETVSLLEYLHWVCVCVYISALLFCQEGVGHIFLYRYLSSVPASQEWGRRSMDLREGDCSSV
jgi:hypothetical protein